MVGRADFRLVGAVEEGLEWLSRPFDGNRTACFEAALADMARRRMLEDPDTPVEPSRLPGWPRLLLAYFVAFSRAKAGVGPFRLERPPSGGDWERSGAMGFLVLHQEETLTPDGIRFTGESRWAWTEFFAELGVRAAAGADPCISGRLL